MNKKLIKTLVSITCGLGIASATSFSLTSCNSTDAPNLNINSYWDEDGVKSNSLEAVADRIVKLEGHFVTTIKDEQTTKPVNYWIKSSSIPNWKSVIELYGDNNDQIVVKNSIDPGEYDLCVRASVMYDNHQEFNDIDFKIKFVDAKYVFSATYDGSDEPHNIDFLDSKTTQLEPKFNVDFSKKPSGELPIVEYEIIPEDDDTRSLNPRWNDTKQTVEWYQITSHNAYLKFKVRIYVKDWKFDSVYIHFNVNLYSETLPYQGDESVFDVNDNGLLVGFKVDFTDPLVYQMYKNNHIMKLPETVTTIKESAFYDSNGTHRSLIPDFIYGIDMSSCSSLLNIPEYSFANCRSVATVILPRNLLKIGKCAFTSAEKLTQINIPNSLEEIDDYAFASTTSLKMSLNFPNSIKRIGDDSFDSSGVVNLSFYDCYSLESLGDGCFAGCKNLANVNLDGCIALTEIKDFAFDLCSSLKTVSFVDCTNLTTIGKSAFCYCVNLVSFDFSSLTSLRSIGDNCFQNCISLESKLVLNYGISSGQKGPNLFVGERAFDSCIKIHEILFNFKTNLSTDPREFAKVVQLGPNSFASIGMNYDGSYPLTLGGTLNYKVISSDKPWHDYSDDDFSTFLAGYGYYVGYYDDEGNWVSTGGSTSFPSGSWKASKINQNIER